MNYYIQGDAANADRIRAAFEKLGYDTITNGWNFNADCGVYFTNEADKLVDYTHIKTFVNLIKTHPDYQELELPKHKFGVGDWIVRNNGSSEVPIQIYNIKKDRYLVTNMLGSKGKLMINRQDEWRLWTIQDAKDGDVLVLNGFSKEYKWIGIFKAHTSDTSFSSHCHYNCGMCEFVTDIARCTKHGIKYNDIRPATNEERDILFAKMQEAGYEWDADKKELKKIQKHYDIANFKPFDKVLVRDRNDEPWRIAFYGYYNEEAHYSHFVGTCWSKQCIPFEGNEHLLGTTDMPSEEYINW